MFKKFIVILLAGLLISSVLSGCGILKKKGDASPGPSSSSAPYVEEPATTDYIANIGDEKIYTSLFSYFYDINFRTLLSKEPQSSFNFPQDATDAQITDTLNQIILKKDAEGKTIKEKAKDLALVEVQKFITDYILAKRNGYKVDEEARKTELEQVESYLASYVTETTTKDMIMKQQTGMNLQDYKRLTEYLNVMTQYDNAEIAKIAYTDADLKAYYDSNVNKFRTVSIRQTLLSIYKDQSQTTKLTDAEIAEKKALANTLLKQIKEGTLSAKGIAKGYSEDPGVTENEGLYDVTSDSNYVSEFKDWAIKQTEANVKNSDIIETTYGFHIMTVEKIDTYDSSETIRSNVKTAYLQDKHDANLKVAAATDEFKLTGLNNDIIDKSITNYIPSFIQNFLSNK